MKNLLIAVCAIAGVAVAQQPAQQAQPKGRFAATGPVHKWPMVKYQRCLDYNNIHTKDEFFACENSYLDGLIAQWKDQVKPGTKLVLSGQAQFLHGLGIARYSNETLIAYVRQMHEAHAGRIDMNPSPKAWLEPLPDTIAKYDVAIAEIKRLGMQIAFNPTTFPNFDPPAKYADWQQQSAKMYAEMARRYKPDVFSVMHEPWSMNLRLHEHVTPQQWRENVEANVRIVKRESPKSKCVASFLPNELDVLEEVLKVKELDGIGLDIYHEYDDFATFDKMIRMAHDAGKFAYVAETGRTMITFRMNTMDYDAVDSIADAQLGKLDPKWMEMMCLYAATRGLTAVTEFWTSPFFSYGDGSSMDPTTPQYAAAVEKAMLQGVHTPAFDAFKALAIKYGDGR